MEPREHTWGSPETITVKDVAREAGVSQSAASVVLNGAQSGTRVSAERRRQVLEVARRMGYRPNALARSLITGKTDRIGFYTGRGSLDARNAFFAEIFSGLFAAAADFRMNTVFHTSGWSHEDLLSLVSNRAMDGLIVHAAADDPIVPLLGELRAPAAAVADAIAGLPSVIVDDETGGTLIGRHLAMLGHRHVMFKQAISPTESARIRLSAARSVLERHGVLVTERIETFDENDGLDRRDIELVSDGPDRVTAVFAWSDKAAERVCNRLLALGVSIPGDVAVVGFDGYACQPAQRYALTTIRAPWAEVGRKAAHLVMDMVNGKSVPMLTLLPVEFIRGNTT